MGEGVVRLLRGLGLAPNVADRGLFLKKGLGQPAQRELSGRLLC